MTVEHAHHRSRGLERIRQDDAGHPRDSGVGQARAEGRDLKHAHHEFDIDQPGKDSWRHREAGASEVAIVSRRRWALVHELGDEPEPPLSDMLGRLSPVDLVIVEGFKRHRHPKLEVYRAIVGKPLLHPDDDCIVAIATDTALPRAELPVLPLDAVDKIADVLQAEARAPDRIPPPREQP
jgi:molybdopterin-guanine dinucleotide biosynthesis protein B